MCFPHLSPDDIASAIKRGEAKTKERYEASLAGKADRFVRLNAMLNLSQLYEVIFNRVAEHFYDEKLPHHHDDTQKNMYNYGETLFECKASMDLLATIVTCTEKASPDCPAVGELVATILQRQEAMASYLAPYNYMAKDRIRGRDCLVLAM